MHWVPLVRRFNQETPALQAESVVLEAQGHSTHKDVLQCLSALRKAERAFNSVSGLNTPPWLQYFDHAYMSAKFAHALRGIGNLDEAENFARHSLQMCDGYDRGRLFNTALLAGILADQERIDELGELETARPLAECALTITETALGPDHPTVAIRLGNLAGLLRELGEPETARPLAERALTIRPSNSFPARMRRTHNALRTRLTGDLLQPRSPRSGPGQILERCS